MSRELWLLRHAKAERHPGMEDFDRALKKRGKRAALNLGEWLKQQNLIPDLVLSSPAKRAISTAIRVLEGMDETEITVIQDRRLYGEGFERLKTVLAESSANAHRVLLVGHNPELEDLLTYLLGIAHVPDRDKLLPTAALARLDMPDDWSDLATESARLLSIIDLRSIEEE
jgi:phosphohistidine phosphatase